MMALQSCPFCGSARVLPECSGRVQQLVCLACGARGPEVARILPAADAEAAWNSRKGVLPSDHVNAAGILGGDMPATVVQKLDAAARAAGVSPTRRPDGYIHVKAGMVISPAQYERTTDKAVWRAFVFADGVKEARRG